MASSFVLKSENLKLAVLLVCCTLSGYVVGALQGIAIFLFDPEDFKSVLPVSRGALDTIDWSTWIASVPFFVTLSVFIPGIHLAHKVYGKPIGTIYGPLFLVGWALAIGPFFYVFRNIPQ